MPWRRTQGAWSGACSCWSVAELYRPSSLLPPGTALLTVNFDPALVRLLREVKYFLLLELNVPDTANCGEWIAFHKDPNTDLAKSSLQLVVIKQMKGDGQGNDRNGAVLIKLRPHMEVMEAWSPVMSVLGRIAEESHGGGLIKTQPPPGPLIRQLPR